MTGSINQRFAFPRDSLVFWFRVHIEGRRHPTPDVQREFGLLFRHPSSKLLDHLPPLRQLQRHVNPTSHIHR